jgi:endogenous inhibitor of DNA gyrase (YacG/DUF329 family)
MAIMSAIHEPRCVFCRRNAQVEGWRPFCSERCKLQDLAHWADGSYRTAADPAGTHDDDEHFNSDDRNH